jgi:hypothetical protein
VLTAIPVVHGVQHLVRLVDGEHRAFRQRVQVAVGDDGGDLDDVIRVGLQARHFQIDPDQAERISFGHGLVQLFGSNSWVQLSLASLRHHTSRG